MRVRVEVTQQDIKKGERENPFSCPVNRALERATPYLRWSTLGDYANCWKEGDYNRSGETMVRLPKRVERFIQRFDDGKPVEPEVFYVTGVPPRPKAGR